ncbi:thiamine-phosphate synthase [Candidatus Tenderia electrophaga]|jgi:thiamine-phosphate pyrophosphorylase|uniref:Thiamine-phosphate synthase n=1 Tax=Candidatus Tenderia electrophaga TaxID=1748243 RepID=A0A0S2TGB8_9GAMM|nr:thiamine-phosphate synthase [Candidatus Tenderia electrophaga]
MHPLAGLYAITDTTLLPGDALYPGVAAAIAGGARLIQYRDKGADRPRRLATATALLHLCRTHNIPLIINDDVVLASEIGADGVHLGRDDGDVEQARATLGPDAIIGVSCYNEWPRAEAARDAGADYVAFGAFFASATKPHAMPAHATLLKRARQALGLPVAAIGGITPANGAPLVAAGADMLAVIQGIFARPDIRRAAGDYARLFDSSETTMKDAL